MIIKEKGLFRAMKEAYRGGGYKVLVCPVDDERWIFIYNGFWVAAMEMRNVPRKILGLIAEHIGTIPTMEDAYKVRKDDVQKELFEMAEKPIRHILARRMEINRLPVVKRTKLLLDGIEVWQQVDNLQIVRFNPDYSQIAEIDADDSKLTGDMLLRVGEISLAGIMGIQIGEAERHVIEHLSQMQWVEG